MNEQSDIFPNILKLGKVRNTNNNLTESAHRTSLQLNINSADQDDGTETGTGINILYLFHL